MPRSRFIAVIASLMVFAAVAFRTGAADEFVVSPDGDDSAHGTAQDPIRTSHQAQQLARQAVAQGHAVTITLKAGIYRFREPLVLTPEDSGTVQAPVVWQASPGEKVVFSSGEVLKAHWEPFHDGIFKARVPADFVADQLFVNGVCQHMARYPNYDPDQRIMNGFAADCISPARVARWSNPAGGFIHAMHSHLWGDYHYLITGKNKNNTLSYEGGWQNNRQMGMHEQYRYVENIFEELDSAGEWYHDAKTQTLYFYPPAGTDLNRAVVESVKLKGLIEFRGSEKHPVSNVTLRGITFTETARTFMENREPLLRSDWTIYRGGAVLLSGAERCRLEKCVLEHLGGNAIFFSNYNRNCQAVGCLVSDVGGNGVCFVGDPAAVRSPLFEYGQSQSVDAMDKGAGPQTNSYPADCLVDDCLIESTGREEKQTAGVEISMSARVTVRHCTIHDVPRAGINIGDGCWGGDVIEFCDVFDTVKETGDHGSFNSWGRDRFWLPNIKQVDALVARNPQLPKLDCVEPITIRNSRWRCDHGWDIDLDDGSSNYHIYNNLCLAGGIKNREGFNRVVENNICLNNTFHPHVWYADSGDAFRKNIIFAEYRPVGMKHAWGAQIDDNLLHRPKATTLPATPLQQQSGADAHSLIGDAQFINPAGGDFRVKDGSPALALGFVNFPMDQFGVQSPELKRIAGTPVIEGLSGGSVDDAQPSTRWLGAEVKSVTTPGEVSATGLARAEGVIVRRAAPDSAAALAGLRENDVIIRINLTSVGAWKDLQAAWGSTDDGQRVHLDVWRDQKRVGIDLTKGQSLREHLSLDANWKFHLGDAWPGMMQFDKSGVTGGPASDQLPGEVSWRTVNLPHDWAVELPFDRAGDGNHGFKPLGPGFENNSIGWYRREFALPVEDANNRIWLTFDGVFRDATVWVNGWLVKRHEGGYYPFREDITNVVRFGERNVIAVRVDATKFEGWFYEGAGIYRHVWLDKTAPLALAPDGTFVYTTFDDSTPTEKAQVYVDATLLNAQTDSATAEVSCEIISPEGQTLNEFKAPAAPVAGQSKTTFRLSTEITSPILWSPESPKLYKLVSSVHVAGKLIDQQETSFGVRTETFDPAVGFLLNGKRYEIHGTCNHQDHAGVGTAIPDALQDFRVKKLKEMGCNAIRTAHNPPTPELLDACDRLGMLVMDESRTFGGDSENLRKWSDQICRDRNHPCVFIWSIGNEERLVEDTPPGAAVALAMQNCAKSLDPTRPVTYAAPEGNVFRGVNSVIEVRGWNYNYGPGMDAYHAEHPNQPNLGTEQASAVGTRGNYTNDWAAGRIQAYDIVWPGWEATAESWWSYFADRPWLSGGFAWTGFDYRGEPSPCPWPAINSQFGILDTCGFPKDSFYYYQACWTTRPMLHLAPHWNWPGKEGQEIRVEAQSNCRQVELFLNGASLGRQEMKPHSKLVWQVKYAPGTLSAKGFDADGVLLAETQAQTTDAPARIQLTPDRNVINADGEDVAVFTVAALDAQNRVVPFAQNTIKFAVAGAGQIIGVGNGDPTCHEPDTYVTTDNAGWSRSLFNGLAQVIVQSTREPGDIKLTAESDGLIPATVVVQAQRCVLRPAVP